MNKESAQIVFRGGTQNTTINTTTLTHIWTNINMRLVLGSMWNKYKRFKINLVESLSVAGAINTSDRISTIYMSGLNFENDYNMATNSTNSVSLIAPKEAMRNRGNLGTFIQLTNLGFAQTMSSDTGAIFRKSDDEVVSLSLEFEKLYGIGTFLNANPSYLLIFTIFGIEEDENII